MREDGLTTLKTEIGERISMMQKHKIDVPAPDFDDVDELTDEHRHIRIQTLRSVLKMIKRLEK